MTERPNIRRLQVSEKQKEVELSFDLEKEITESDWNEMRKHLQLWERPKHEAYADLAWGIKLLDPAKLPQASTEVWVRMQSKFHSARTERQWKQYCDLAYTLKIPWPEEGLVDRRSKKSVRSALQEEADRGNGLAYAAVINLLFQDQPYQPPTGFAERIRSQIRGYALNNQWRQFVSSGSLARVACQMNSFKIDKRAQNELRKLLADMRKSGKWEDFAVCAAQIKMLTAEEVRVDKHGLTLVMPKKAPKMSDQYTFPPMPSTPEL